tara:strand:- start:42 stop:335 length:294 start_codon:yes stop_codon:yes gene_type:complete
MRIISRKVLRICWEKYPDAETSLKFWYRTAKETDWSTPRDIKAQYRNASFVGNDRVVFNIAGNKYRLVVAVNYAYQALYVRFVGTHRQYDQIDVKEI